MGMQKTNLVWDNYIDFLIDAINESKFMKRAENKPMTTPKTAQESHVTTRAIHLRESADVAKRLAKGLGLNEDYIYAAMLMHDAGHPFSAHEGEEIFSFLGEIYNTQYFHHNAKGIEIILSEDICEKAISKIPNIDSKPELRKKLKEEFYYFLDAVISHDGEATKEDMMRREEIYPSIQEAVETKMRLANSDNKYKFIAQTPEGKLAKYADVIAYLASDMQDGFALGILKGFSDDYLELFGEMLSPEYPVTREDKIDCGRRIIEEIKRKNLRENREIKKYLGGQEAEIQETVTRILARLQEEGIKDVYTGDVTLIQEIIEQEQENYRKNKLLEFYKLKGMEISEEEQDKIEKSILQKLEDGTELSASEEEYAQTLNTINSRTNKIEEFATKMLKARSSVIFEITSRMKEFFINDLIKNSQNQDVPQFSNAAWDMFFKAKKINYREFVQYTKWDYQTIHLPKAALELSEKCAEGLIKSGGIRNKFYDEAVRKHVKDEATLKYMRTKYKPEATYISYRKQHGIGDIKAVARPSKDKFTGTKEEYELMKLLSEVYSYVENEDEVFAIRFQNTFNAIRTRIIKKVETALTAEHKTSNAIFTEEVQAQIEEIRAEILNQYGTTDLNEEQKAKFIETKIEQELEDLEKKMAIQLATDYLAGMTDKSFLDLAIRTGKIPKEVVEESVRGNIQSDQVKDLIKRIEEQEQFNLNPTGAEDPNGVGDGR